MLLKSTTRKLTAALRDLGHDNTKVRVSAARDLATHYEAHRSEVVKALCNALGDDDAAVRAAAADALADTADETAVDALLPLVDEAHTSVREMALVALGEIGSPRAVNAIARALSDETAAIRFQAVMAFARCCDDHERVVAGLLEATHDSDPLVVHIALRMAEEQGTRDGDERIDPQLVERARGLLRAEADMVRIVSAIVLARSNVPDGDEVLTAIANRELETDEAADIAAALELCGQRRLHEATDGLERRAFGRTSLLKNDPFSWHARVALAAMGHERACAWILTELRTWNRERRSLAVAAAEQARLIAAKPVLEAMQGDPSRADPDAVASALGVLSAPSVPGARSVPSERSVPSAPNVHGED